MDEQSPSARSRRHIALALFLGALVIYHLHGGGPVEVDVYPAKYGAWSLVRASSFELQHWKEYEHLAALVGEAVVAVEGRWLSKYPPGTIVTALPVFGPLAAAYPEPVSTGRLRTFGKLTGALYAAGTVALFYLLVLRVAPSGALPASILLGFGTNLYSIAGQGLWSHGPATFLLTLGLYLNVATSGIGHVARGGLAGGAIGLAVATRPTTVLFLAAAAVAGLVRRRGAETAALLVVAAIPTGLMMLYNAHHFGTLISGGYEQEATRFTAPFLEGLLGLTVAPSRGMLIYTPALLLAPLGMWAWLHRSKAAPTSCNPGHALPADHHDRFWPVVCWAVAALATVLLYAKWHSWWGGWSFGPRMLCETLPAFCLLFAIAYHRWNARWFRTGAALLIALSICVHAVGMFGMDAYRPWHEARALPEGLFTLGDTQIEAHARAMLGFEKHDSSE